MVAVKLIPQLLSWAAIVFLLLRGFSGRRTVVTAAPIAGFAAGMAGASFLLNSFPGDITFGIIKNCVGVGFILLWGISVAAIYRSAGRGLPMSWGERFSGTRLCAGAAALAAGIIMGAVCVGRIAGADSTQICLFIGLVAAVLVFAALAVEKYIPSVLSVSPSGLMLAVVALLLFSSASIIRLDVFSPLTMKTMKFAHDFVHQFFESMLIPDHLFIRPSIWGYIGLLFSKEIGFWGGMIIWFTPGILVLLAIRFERLPSVAHIRQGAERRKLLAAAIRGRRYRLVIPAIAVMVLAAAVYKSRFPSVEYWDPKPMLVTAGPSGEIFIPKKGEVDLEDGKLHKYLYKRGDKEARFFVLQTSGGKLTVDLDACAICKPDGYGQAEGTVICYYCKTLIPLETVGMPGGCNPVPVSFTEKDDGVHIDGLTLINNWSGTVQATTRIKEGGK